MDINQLKKNLLGIPHTLPEDGETLYNFILKEKPKRILELGFDHGVSTCWMAQAANEIGAIIDTIDRPDALNSKPDIFENLKKNALEDSVNVIISERTYIWELRNLIKMQSENGICKPIYDFCFIDGAHNWETDGFAFFLVDKLLKPGGWILFDDLEWTYAESKGLAEFDWVKSMPKEEKETRQVKDIVELLISQHSSYGNLKIIGKWAWVQKVVGKSDSQINFDEFYTKLSISRATKNYLREIKKTLIR